MYKKLNYAIGDVASTTAIDATTLTLKAGHTITTDIGEINKFVAVFYDGTKSSPYQDTNREIVEAYRTNTNDFVIARAKEGTSAKQWIENDKFMLIASAGVFNEYETELDAKANLISPSFTTPNIGAATGSSLALEGTTLGMLSLKNTTPTAYTRMLFDGTGVDFTQGVGNSSAAIADLQNKFYIYDFTNSKIAMTVTPNTLATKFYGSLETVGGATIGGTVALGANNITMTGSLAATGARVTKGWFTNIESTNMPTVGGTAILTSLTAPQFATIELGHASDTTLSRSAAGVLAVEGNNVLTTANKASASDVDTGTDDVKYVTAKSIKGSGYSKLVGTTTSTATPEPEYGRRSNEYYITALATAATFAAPVLSVTGGTLVNGDSLLIRIKDNGTARTLAWNAIYRAIGVVLPTTTVANKTIYIGCKYNSGDSKWDVLAVGEEA
jgi:hypothetical protein